MFLQLLSLILCFLIQLLMRSTLPALFRNSHSTDDRKNKSPSKQGPFYDLNLTISHNSYRTKIINPHQSKQFTDDLSRSAYLKPLIGRYANKHKRAISMGIESNEGQSIQNHSHHRLSQIDNVKFNLRRVQNEANLLQQKVKEVPDLHRLFMEEIRQSEQKLHSQVDKINEEWQINIIKLRQKMSHLRRETNMEQKMFKKDISIINDELIDCISVIKGVEQQRATLKSLNF